MWDSLVQTGLEKILDPSDVPTTADGSEPFAEWFNDFVKTSRDRIRATLDSEGELDDDEISSGSDSDDEGDLGNEGAPAPSRTSSISHQVWMPLQVAAPPF